MMKGLTLTTKEQARLQILNGVLDARIQPSSESGEDMPPLVVALTNGKEDVCYHTPVALLT